MDSADEVPSLSSPDRIFLLFIRPCFKNRAELCYFNKIAIAAIWTKARNEASSLS